jgi:hypothetical protein
MESTYKDSRTEDRSTVADVTSLIVEDVDLISRGTATYSNYFSEIIFSDDPNNDPGEVNL